MTKTTPQRGPRASSATLRAKAAEQRSRRVEEELVWWALSEPEGVRAWLQPVLFADPVLHRAVALLAEHVDINVAADFVAESDDAGDHDAVVALRRLSVAAPVSTDCDDVLAIVVANATSRVIASIMAQRDDATAEELGAVRTLKLLSEALHEPEHRVAALAQLVPWLASWDAQRRQVNPAPAQQPTTGNASSS